MVSAVWRMANCCIEYFFADTQTCMHCKGRFNKGYNKKNERKKEIYLKHLNMLVNNWTIHLYHGSYRPLLYADVFTWFHRLQWMVTVDQNMSKISSALQDDSSVEQKKSKAKKFRWDYWIPKAYLSSISMNMHLLFSPRKGPWGSSKLYIILKHHQGWIQIVWHMVLHWYTSHSWR